MRHQDNPNVLLSSHLTSLTEGVGSSLESVSHLIDSSPSKAVLDLGLISIASLGPRASTKVESHVNFTES